MSIETAPADLLAEAHRKDYHGGWLVDDCPVCAEEAQGLLPPDMAAYRITSWLDGGDDADIVARGRDDEPDLMAGDLRNVVRQNWQLRDINRRARALCEQQAAELKALRDAVAVARPVLQASWDAALAMALPVWRALDPILAPATEAEGAQ